MGGLWGSQELARRPFSSGSEESPDAAPLLNRGGNGGALVLRFETFEAHGTLNVYIIYMYIHKYIHTSILIYIYYYIYISLI